MMYAGNIVGLGTMTVRLLRCLRRKIDAMRAPHLPQGVGTTRAAVEMGSLPTPPVMHPGYQIMHLGVAILEVRDTKYGRGVFALVDLDAHVDIIMARGQLLLSHEEQTLEEMRYTWTSDDSEAVFVFSQFVEAEANIVRLINSSHGCYGRTNCKVRWVAGGMIPMVSTTHKIRAGKQLLISYNVM